MRIIHLFILFFIFSTSCKKEAWPGSSNSQGNSRVKFVDTIYTSSTSNTPLFAGYTGLSDFLLVIQKENSGLYSLYKTNNNANLFSTYTLNLGSEQLMKITGSKTSDDFYTLTATNNFTLTSAPQINAYSYATSSHDSIADCDSVRINDYVYSSPFDLGKEINLQNHTTLRKFDAFANELWVKTLDGHWFDENNLETDQNGNVYVLTATKGGYQPTANIQFTNSTMPYFDFKLDSNEFSLYKFNSNGIQLFKKTFTGVLDEHPGVFKPSLALSSNNISIATINSLFVFDINGNLISTTKPVKNTCNNYIKSNVGHAYLPHVLIYGYLRYNYNLNSYSNYLVKSVSGNFGPPFSYSGPLLSAMDGNGNYYCLNNPIVKLNSAGNIIYTKTIIYMGLQVNINPNNALTDKSNSVFIFNKNVNQILIYKLDQNGDYQ